MTSPVITSWVGVDPGRRSGAVVRVDQSGGLLQAWCAWSVCAAGWRVRRSGAAESTVSSLGQVGEQLAAELEPWALAGHGFGLVVERVFVHPERRHGAVELAESRGEVAGPLRRLALVELEPFASEWRARMLGLGRRTPAAQAERAAVRVAAALWPELARELDEAGATKVERGAVSEAALMARMGAVSEGARRRLESGGSGRRGR